MAGVGGIGRAEDFAAEAEKAIVAHLGGASPAQIREWASAYVVAARAEVPLLRRALKALEFLTSVPALLDSDDESSGSSGVPLGSLTGERPPIEATVSAEKS